LKFANILLHHWMLLNSMMPTIRRL